MFVLSIILGFLAGCIGNKVANERNQWTLLDIALGVVGAIAGGYLFNTAGQHAITELSIGSSLFAPLGAIAFLIVAQVLRRLT